MLILLQTISQVCRSSGKIIKVVVMILLSMVFKYIQDQRESKLTIVQVVQLMIVVMLLKLELIGAIGKIQEPTPITSAKEVIVTVSQLEDLVSVAVEQTTNFHEVSHI